MGRPGKAGKGRKTKSVCFDLPCLATIHFSCLSRNGRPCYIKWTARPAAFALSLLFSALLCYTTTTISSTAAHSALITVVRPPARACSMQPTHRTKLSTANSLPPKSPPPVSYSLPRSLSPPAQSHYVPSRSPPMSPTPPLKTSANAHGHGHGHGRRPSLSSWLSRTSSNGSHVGPYAASKPVRISEPKLAHDLGLLGNYSRSGALGTGALVVRTPQEALAGSGVTPDYESGPEEDLIEEEESESEEVHVHQSQSDHHSQSQSQSEVNGSSIRVATRRRNSSSSQPESPPLPPLPLSKSTSALGSTKDLPPRTRTSPPSRPPPPPPALAPTAAAAASSAPSRAQVQAQHPPSRPAMKHSATSPDPHHWPVPSRHLHHAHAHVHFHFHPHWCAYYTATRF